jgi:branched-chain amino acid transport system permease protein
LIMEALTDKIRKAPSRYIISILIALFILLPFLTPYTALASEMLIFALFAMAYDIVLGYSGMLSFGHAAFFGLGAYGTGIMLVHVKAPLFVAILVGVILSFIAAWPMGYLSIRRRGIYFAMVTLAFAQMFYFIAFKWTTLTGGDDGLQRIPRPPVGPIMLESELALYYFILIFVSASMLVGLRIVNSPFGKALQAMRENENRARSIGFNILRFKLFAFVISAFFSGLAGSFYALLLNYVPLGSMHWANSGEVVMMTIVGGMGTLFGPMLGAIAVVLVRDIIGSYTESWNLIMGVLFMIAVLSFRRGILGFLKERL